ncbi:MAG: single-stranded DNA-binding protein [Brevundimonas sp.]
MSSINKVIIVGRLGADPEARTTENGTKVVTLSVATSEKWTDKTSGDKKEKTEWHRVTIWGGRDNDGLAGIAEKYLKKGHNVYLSGKLQTRKWTDKDNIERYTTVVVLNGFSAELVLLEGTGGNGGNRPPPPNGPEDYGRTSNSGSASQNGGGSGAPGSMDDDIPFSPQVD